MIGIGIVGYGYWGPNLLRNFNELPNVRVIYVSNVTTERRASIIWRYITNVLLVDENTSK